MVPRCYDQIERAIRDEPKLKGGFSTVGPTLLFTKNALSLGKNEPTQDISKDNLGNFETISLEKSMQLAPAPLGPPVLPLRAPGASPSPPVQTKGTAVWVSTTAGPFAFEEIWW